MSILGLGIPGLIGGIALMLVGGATMVFGANEIVSAATGTNYIQQWTGMSDTAYGWTYLGLNIASSVGQIAGNVFYLESVKSPRIGYDGKSNGFRYKTKNGKMFDFDYPHGNIRKKTFSWLEWTRVNRQDKRTTLELFKIDMVANIREVIYGRPVY